MTHLSKQLYVSENKENRCKIQGLDLLNIDQNIVIDKNYYENCKTIEINYIEAIDSIIDNITIQGKINIIYQQQLEQQQFVQISDFKLQNCSQNSLKTNLQLYINDELVTKLIDYPFIQFNILYPTEQLLETEEIQIYFWDEKQYFDYIEYVQMVKNTVNKTQIMYEYQDMYIRALQLENFTSNMNFNQQASTYYNNIKYIRLIQNQQNIDIVSCYINESISKIGNTYLCNYNECIQNKTYLFLGLCIEKCDQTLFNYTQNNQCVDQCDWYEAYYLQNQNQCIRCNDILHNDTQVCNQEGCYTNEKYYIDYNNIFNSNSKLYKYYQKYENNQVCFTQFTLYKCEMQSYKCTLISLSQCQYANKQYMGKDEKCYDELQYGLFEQYDKLNYQCDKMIYYMKCLNSYTNPSEIQKLYNDSGFYNLNCFSNNYIQNNKTKQCIQNEQCYSCNTFVDIYQCSDCPMNIVLNYTTFQCQECLYQDQNEQCVEQQQCTHFTSKENQIMCSKVCWDQCPEQYKYYVQYTKECFQQCPESYKYQNIIDNEIYCLESCNSQIVDSITLQQCINQCNTEYIEYYQDNNYMCIDQCNYFVQQTFINEQKYQECVQVCQNLFIQNNYTCVQTCDEQFKYIQKIEVDYQEQYQCQQQCDKYILNTTIYNTDVQLCEQECEYYINNTHCSLYCQYKLELNNTCVDDCTGYFISYINDICTQNCPKYVQVYDQNQYKCEKYCFYYINQTIINQQQVQLCQNQCTQFIKGNQCLDYCEFYYKETKQCTDQCQVIINIEQTQKCQINCQQYVNIQNQNYQCLQNCDYVQYYDYILKYNVCLQCNDQFYNQCSVINENKTCIGQQICDDQCVSNIIALQQQQNICVDQCPTNYIYHEYIALSHEQKYKMCLQNCNQSINNNQMDQEGRCVYNCSQQFKQYYKTCYLNYCENFIKINDDLKQQCVESCSQYNLTVNQKINICQNNCTYINIDKQEFQCSDPCKNYIYKSQYNNKDVMICNIMCQQVIQDIYCQSQCVDYNYIFYNNSNMFCIKDCEYKLIKDKQYKQTVCVEECNYKNHTLIQEDYCVQTCGKNYQNNNGICIYVNKKVKIITSVVVVTFLITVLILVMSHHICKQRLSFKKNKQQIQMQPVNQQKDKEAQKQIQELQQPIDLKATQYDYE